jgi:flagellar hook-basal body complex protein FliE
MPIDQITSVAASTGASYLPPVEVAPSGTNHAFANQLTTAIDGLQALNGTKDTLGMAALTGDLQNVHEATIAAARASTTLELFAGLRNKGTEAFNEIMRMQA